MVVSFPRDGQGLEAGVLQSRLVRRSYRLYLPLLTVSAQFDDMGAVEARTDAMVNSALESMESHFQSLDGVVQLDFAVLYNGAFEDMYFDWFEIEYARRFQAEGDQLLFPGEEGGTWQYEIEGFTNPDEKAEIFLRTTLYAL